MAIEQPANPLYKDKEVLDFELILDNNFYTNLKSLRICFPLHIKKLSNSAANLHGDIYLVNNFLAHWVKEIDILKYGTNKSLIPRKSIYTLTRCLNICQKNASECFKMTFSMIKNWGLLREVMIDAFTITITNHLELMITLKIAKINLKCKSTQNTSIVPLVFILEFIFLRSWKN